MLYDFKGIGGKLTYPTATPKKPTRLLNIESCKETGKTNPGNGVSSEQKIKMLSLRMEKIRLDRTLFKAQTLEDADKHSDYYKKLSWQERLEVAAYLNSVAYNYDLNNPPCMDKTQFSVKSIFS